MKKLIFLFSFVLAALIASAQSHIITVSKSPDKPAQYTDLQDAIDAAKAGDTIYVLGTTANYGDIRIEKDSITLIGAGFEPSYDGFASKLNKLIICCADYVTIKGFYFTDSLLIYGQKSTEDYASYITIENNYIYDEYLYIPYYANNILIRGNVSYYILVGSSSDDQHIDDHVYGISIFNNFVCCVQQENHYSSIHVYNNIIKSSVSGYNEVIRNNIFYYDYDGTINLEFQVPDPDDAIIENNLFYNSSYNDDVYSNDTSIKNHNILNESAQFVSPAFPFYSAKADYHLQSTSPGHNYGTDGTDIGIYGGGYNFSKTGEVLDLPAIYHLSVLNSTVHQEDTLKVRIKVRTNP